MFYWLFINFNTNQFVILSDEELGQEGRWILEDDEYTLVWDSARSIKEAEEYAKRFYNATKMKLNTMPITLKEAAQFVNSYHRHHVAPQGHKFSIGLTDGDSLIGVIIAGRPVARHNDDGFTLEVTRCCVKPTYKNGCSKLYAAVCSIAREMGYKKVITYTLAGEQGSSLKASGFELLGVSRGGSWNCKARKRIDKHPTGKKNVWYKKIS